MRDDGKNGRPRRRFQISAAAAVALGSLSFPAAPARTETAHPDPRVAIVPQPYLGPGQIGTPVRPSPDGSILDFAARGVTLLSWIPIPAFGDGSISANDVWGYVSPSGREYAIIGLEKGTGLVEVTDPIEPQVIEVVYHSPSPWSDMDVFGAYAYSVNEEAGGVQIIDLSRIDEGIVDTPAAYHGGIATAHNITVNRETGFAYVVGSNLGVGGVRILEVSDPLDPIGVASWEVTYVHDIEVMVWDHGPYAGREIAFCACGGAGLYILDVTNKLSIDILANFQYPNRTYCHQVRVDEARELIFLNDELDERDDPDVTTTTTYFASLADLTAPEYLGSFTNGLPAIDHNFMLRGNFLYQANYTSGLRIWTVNDLEDIRQRSWFDTHPGSNQPEFAGAWGVYTGLPSEIVLVSDINRGLFVLYHGLSTDIPTAGGAGPPLALGANPNPFRESATVHFSMPADGNGVLRVVDVQGRTVETLRQGRFSAGVHVLGWEPGRSMRAVAPGVYFAVLETESGSAVQRLVFLR